MTSQHGGAVRATRPASTPDRVHEPKLVRRLKERREHHKKHGPVYRGAFVIAGTALTVGGVVMLALPGPAFLVIPMGLAMLSLEFAWAGRLLDKSLEQAHRAQRRAAATSTRQKVVTVGAMACAAAAFVAWAVTGDVPLLPV
jgi:uncharacterized protein (TIGR02611 family)